MGLNIRKTRSLYESYVPRDRRQGQPGRGRLAFVNLMRNQLGLCDQDGNDYRDHAGNRMIKNQRLRAEQFSLQEMAQAMVPNWQEFFDPSKDMSSYARARMLVEGSYPGDQRALLEATGAGVDVSAFADINAWTAVVGGLIEVKVLEAFKNPQFIADELMPAEPTKLNGQKVIGTGRIGPKGEPRQPGEAHKRAGFGERWVQTPQTRENGLACDILKETAFFDLTGNVLNEAAQVGEWLAYQKELDVIDCTIGVTSQSGGASQFNYKGTNTNTYQATNANGFGYINSQSNALLDWTNLESSWLLFVRMVDPETNTRVLINPNLIIVNPAKLNTAKLILGATMTEVRTSGGATQSTAATLQVRQTPGSPYANEYRVVWSPLIEQRCTDATGLALSQANANLYWWHLQQGKPFRYMQNWPLNVQQAAANNYDMLDRGVVASYFANERGIPSVWSPWHIVQNTN